MPANHTEIEKKLWASADELRSQLQPQILRILRPRPGPHLPAFRRPTLCSRRARTNRHRPRRQSPYNWQVRLPGSRRHVPATTGAFLLPAQAA